MPPKIVDDDEEIIKKPTKKKLVVDEDEDEEVIKKPTKKKVVDDDDDEVVKKPTKKKPVVADDDDDEGVVKKPTKKKVVVDDEAAPQKAASHVDPEANSIEKPKEKVRSKFGAEISVSSAKGVDATAGGASRESWVPPAYDAMDLNAFIEHLKSKSKLQTMDEISRRNEKERQAILAEQKEKIEPFPDGTGGHSYETMLNTFMESTGVVAAQDLEFSEPDLGKEGSKKVVIVNFMKICEDMGRDSELVRKYLDGKLSVRAASSMNGKDQLVMNVNPSSLPKTKLIEKLKTFAAEYIRCAQCGGFNTQLSQTLTLTCNECGAQRQVQQERNVHMSDTSKRKKRR